MSALRRVCGAEPGPDTRNVLEQPRRVQAKYQLWMKAHVRL